MKPRPTLSQPGDRKAPTKFRFLKPGVMLFTPTLAERAKLALGYSIRVDVLMKMQHNPGEVQVASSWKPVEQLPTKDMPTIPAIPPAPPKEEHGS